MHLSQYLNACREFAENQDGVSLAKCVSLRDPHSIDRTLLSQDKGRSEYHVEKPINEIVAGHLKVIRTLNKERKRSHLLNPDPPLIPPSFQPATTTRPTNTSRDAHRPSLRCCKSTRTATGACR